MENRFKKKMDVRETSCEEGNDYKPDGDDGSTGQDEGSGNTEGFKIDLGLNDRHVGKKKEQSVNPEDLCMKNAVEDDSAILLRQQILT